VIAARELGTDAIYGQRARGRLLISEVPVVPGYVDEPYEIRTETWVGEETGLPIRTEVTFGDSGTVTLIEYFYLVGGDVVSEEMFSIDTR
jgi:hypothetical protein